MQLREVLGDAARDAPPVEVTALAYDNRRVTPGTLFFCVPGFTRDGHDFAPDAIARGASALVVERPLGLGAPEVRLVHGVPEVAVDSGRAAMAPIAARFHGDPTARLPVVGITGTNGKTTSAFLIRELLEAAGRQTALLGTVKSVIGGAGEPLARTTPEAIDLQAAFAEMLRAGDTACAMEVSSHALELHRADAIHWDAAVFTNLTMDHLDFHPTMEDYYVAKRRLFETDPRVVVINIDDEYGRRLRDELGRGTTIALERDADLRATDVRMTMSGAEFTVDGLRLRSPLPGRFNVLNVLGAVAVARALGVH